MGGWETLLASDEERVLPWTGGGKVYFRDRAWKLAGNFPVEYGWFRFKTSGGRRAILLGPADDIDPEFEATHKTITGYLTGDRLIPDDARVDIDPKKLIAQTIPVFLVEPGLDRFGRAVVACLTNDVHVYLRQEFPQGPEAEVTEAYEDRLKSLDHIQGITPALDLAFRWVSLQREKAEEREKERQKRLEKEQKKREAEERMREAMKDIGTGAGRRAMAKIDFNAAAKAALAVTGAELLDARHSRNPGEMVVRYRFQRRRLECVVNRQTLRIIDAGICLDDHEGTKGDTRFTLESLPAVVKWAC